MNDEIPLWYCRLRERHVDWIQAVEHLGEAARAAGPLDEKTVHLLQLVAAAAVHSEGAVHSHVRRALQCGADSDEIRHALIVATGLVGFPTVSAALRWAEDVLERREDFHLVAE
ncbi:MAG: carboxymuconolactone decarboxylase family protein [Thiohalomonadaceae bacterium]